MYNMSVSRLCSVLLFHATIYRQSDGDVLSEMQTMCVFQENPYVMLRQNHQELEGNDRYEGFCVDMLKELADILKFKYRIRLVGDGLYGVPGANGTWTGMVGELISRVCKYIHMHKLHEIINYHSYHIIYM